MNFVKLHSPQQKIVKLDFVVKLVIQVCEKSLEKSLVSTVKKFFLLGEIIEHDTALGRVRHRQTTIKELVK